MDFGGVSGGFQTPMNTLGIGNPVPFGQGCAGSGDLFGQAPKAKGKKKAPFSVKAGAPAVNYAQGIPQQLPLIVMADKKG